MDQAAASNGRQGLTAAFSAPDEFARCVLGPLARLRRRLRTYLIVDGLAVVFMVLMIAAGVQFAIDRVFRLPTDMRALVLACAIGAVGAAAWRRLIAPLAVRLPAAELAVLVERQAPHLNSRLVSAVELAASPSASLAPAADRSPAMVRMVLQQAAAEAAGVPWGRVLNHRRALRRGLTIVACAAIAAMAVRLAGDTVGLWFRRNVLLLDEPWPQRTRLLVEGLRDGKLLCARGDDLTISALVARGSEVPRQVFVEYEGPGGPSGLEQMVQIGRGRFQRVFERVAASMRCRVRGGDDRTGWFDVEVVDRPAIANLVIGVEPPKYTGLSAYSLRPGLTAVEAIKGSRLRFRITTNKAVVRAALLRAGRPLDGQVVQLSDTEWEGRDQPPHGTAYHFELVDALGLTNHSERSRPMQISVHLLPDAPPRVKLYVRGVSDMVTPEAVLPAQVDFADTYGLAAVALVQESTRPTTAPRSLPIEGFAAGGKTFARSLSWPLTPLGLMPGDRLSLYAEARDYDDVSGPNVGKSPVVSLRVVSREELLNELARREQQFRQEFETLVRGQEDLYAAVLSVLTGIGSGAAGDEHRQEFGRLERRQRQQSARVDAVRRRLEQVLAEMEVNQALTPATRERLGTRIVAPMAELVRTAMAEAVFELGRLARQDSADERQRLQTTQRQVVAAMRAILANMLRYEGFQEAVSLLRDIMSLQGSVSEETEKQIAQEAEKLFGAEAK